MPNVGYSSRRGGVIGLAYYQTFGDSYDATFYVDHYTEGLETFGADFRYAPVIGTDGRMETLIVDDSNNIFGGPEDEGDLRADTHSSPSISVPSNEL